MKFGVPLPRSGKTLKWVLRVVPAATWVLFIFLIISWIFNQEFLEGEEGVLSVIFICLVSAYVIIGYFVIPPLLAGFFDRPDYKIKYTILSAATAGLWPLIIYYRHVDRSL